MTISPVAIAMSAVEVTSVIAQRIVLNFCQMNILVNATEIL